MNYLKRKVVRIESLNDEIEIRQLSAKAQAEIIVAYRDEAHRYRAGFIAAKYGVPAWSDMSIDEISDALTMIQLNEINDAISELSGIDEKNSVSTQSDSSSSS